VQIAASLFACETAFSIDRSVERARPTVPIIPSLVLQEGREGERKREGKKREKKRKTESDRESTSLCSVLDLEFQAHRAYTEEVLSLVHVTDS